MSAKSPTLRDRLAVYGVLVVVQLFYGVHYLAAKAVVQEIAPRSYTLLRIEGGALALTALCLLAGKRLPADRATWGRLALLAVFGVVLNQTLFAEGILRTSPIHSSLINTTIPVTTLLVAVLFRRELLTGRRMLALLTGMAGALLVIRPSPAAFEGTMLQGDLLTWANALSFGIFLVFSKRVLERLDPLPAAAALLLCGAVLILPVSATAVAAEDWGAVSAITWWLVLYAALFPTAAAVALWYWALRRVESSFVALFIYLQPVAATLLAFAVRGDRPAPGDAVGGALIFLAVALAQKRRAPVAA